MFLGFDDEKNMKIKSPIHNYREIFRMMIASFKIYEVFCWKREVKWMEDKISKGEKDG